MRLARLLSLTAFTLACLTALPRIAEARNPPNPYSSFNLSGVNYGAMQWDRAQRQGKRVWPYYNTPARGGSRSGGVGVGGMTGGTYGGGTVRSAPRRWRR